MTCRKTFLVTSGHHGPKKSRKNFHHQECRHLRYREDTFDLSRVQCRYPFRHLASVSPDCLCVSSSGICVACKDMRKIRMSPLMTHMLGIMIGNSGYSQGRTRGVTTVPPEPFVMVTSRMFFTCMHVEVMCFRSSAYSSRLHCAVESPIAKACARFVYRMDHSLFLDQGYGAVSRVS